MTMLPAPPPAGYPPAPASVAMARRQVNVPHVVIAWSCAVLTLGYMLPWAIAATRAKSNSLAIALVNFLLGWTLIGWIVALVMSCGSEPQQAVVNVYAQQNTHFGGPGPYPAPPTYEQVAAYGPSPVQAPPMPPPYVPPATEEIAPPQAQ